MNQPSVKGRELGGESIANDALASAEKDRLRDILATVHGAEHGATAMAFREPKSKRFVPPSCRGEAWPQMDSAMPVVFAIVCVIGILAAISLFRAIVV